MVRGTASLDLLAIVPSGQVVSDPLNKCKKTKQTETALRYHHLYPQPTQLAPLPTRFHTLHHGLDPRPDLCFHRVHRALGRHLLPASRMPGRHLPPDKGKLLAHARLRVKRLVPLLAVRAALGRDLGREGEEERGVGQWKTRVGREAVRKVDALGHVSGLCVERRGRGMEVKRSRGYPVFC